MTMSPFATAPLHFKTIVISDTHLGKKAASAAFLFEFLQNVSTQRLILNGDIIEGWGLKHKKREPFPELHARCMDALNAKAEEGAEVIWIRGNHDEDLARKSLGLINQRVVFTDKDGHHNCPISFRKSFRHTDAQGRHFLVLHGDVFDGFMKSTKKKIIAQYADRAYEGLVRVNGAFRRVAHNVAGVHVSPAAYLKRKTKKILGIIGSFEAAVTSGRITEQFDGVICGHIHHAEITQKEKTVYMNSGDWVESCTALVEDFDGNWRIIDWAKERKGLGLSSLPSIDEVNPYASYREVTKRQLALVRRVWPGSDYIELTERFRSCRSELGRKQKELLTLCDMVEIANDNAYILTQGLLKSANKLACKIEKIRGRLQPHP